jgi:hypothetical protein
MEQIFVTCLDGCRRQQQEAIGVFSEQAGGTVGPRLGVPEPAGLVKDHEIQRGRDRLPTLLQASPADCLQRNNASQRCLIAILLETLQELEGAIGIQNVKLKIEAVPHLLPPLNHEMCRRHDQDALHWTTLA